MATGSSFTVDIDTHVLEQIIRNTPEHIKAFLDAEAESMVNDIKRSFANSPATGNTRKRGSKTHVSASPGNPPRVDMSALTNSMTWEPDGDHRRLIMDGVKYGVILELGNTRHNYVWPFMGPAFERENRAFAQHAQDAGLVKP
jgi:hypothetical protein